MPPKKKKAPDKPRKPKKTQYPKETWADIRAAYESGQYTSLEKVDKELREKYKCEGKMFPGPDAIKRKCAKECWDKTLHMKEIEEARHITYRKKAARLGMTDEWLLLKIKEMIEDKNTRNNGIQRLLDVTGDRAPHKVARTDDDGNSVQDAVLILPANGFDPEPE